MSLLWDFLLFVPIIFLVMIVYGGQHEKDRNAVLRAATRKTIKVVLWIVVLVVVMELLQVFLLP